MNAFLRYSCIATFTSILMGTSAMAQKPAQNPGDTTPNGQMMFNYLDKNGDGNISREEFDKARQERQNRQQQSGGQHRELGHNRTHHQEQGNRQQGDVQHHGQRQRWINVMYDRADRNQDGVVSKGEFLIRAEKLFERLDKNEDGLLQKNELKHSKGK
jgi:Ca2+-binding EF-hand superfamily protein